MARMNLMVKLLLASLLVSIPLHTGLAASQPQAAAAVQAVLFWSNGCPHCEAVLLDTLPPIQEQFGDQLKILVVELVTLEDVDRLYEFGAARGLSKEQVQVPMLLLDDTLLIGAEQIPAELPGLVEQHLAAGGVGLPSMPGMQALLGKGVAFTAFDPTQLYSADEPVSSGIGLAWVVMAGMLLALIAAGVGVGRAFQGKTLPAPRGWQVWALPGLAVVGLGIALYLTYVEGSQAQAICGPIGDCNTVQNSRYAKVFGLIPVGLVGALGYIGILVAWGWRRARRGSLAELAGPALFGMTLFGVLYSIYLTYLEIFVIHAVCIWCLSSAVIMALLMLLSLEGVTRWLAAQDEEE